MKNISLISEDGKRLTAIDYDVLKLLSNYVGKLDVRFLEYYKEDKGIKYRNRYFVYEFYDGIHIYEYRNKHYYELTKKDRIRNKKLVTHKKGKIKKGRAVLLRSFLGLIVACGLFGAIKGKKSNFAEPIETLPIETTVGDEPEIETIIDIADDNIYMGESVSNIYDNVQEICIPEINRFDYRLEKREETHEELGGYIDYYATRYGIDPSFMEALITQERHDTKKANPGQLTNSICDGNGFKAPVIQDNEVVGEDKVYIVGSFYNNYPVKDIDTMGHFPNFSESEQESVRQAIRLQKEGYEIIKIGDLKNGTSDEQIKNNIRISALYLSYLVNLKEDLFLGAASYNAGPYRISSDLSYEDLFKGIPNDGDEFYLNHIATYFTDDDLANGFNVILKDGKTIHYDMSNTLKGSLKQWKKYIFCMKIRIF